MTRMAILTLLAAVIPLAAHHSTTAEFDNSKTVAMEGIITKVSWLNPHAGLWMDVKDAAGNAVHWEIELPSPNGLMRQGWQKADLKPGDRVTLDVWLARKGAALASMRSITLPDGRVMTGQSMWDNPIPAMIKQ